MSYQYGSVRVGSGSRRDSVVEDDSWPAAVSRGAKVTIYSVALVCCLVLERATFKIMVDRMLPVRYILIQAVALTYMLMLSVVVIRKTQQGHLFPNVKTFPALHVFFVALLDALQLTMMMLAGAYVTPTLTVLLLQAKVPLSVAIAPSQYHSIQVVGAVVITLATATALTPPIRDWVSSGYAQYQSEGSKVQEQAEGELSSSIPGVNSLVYVLSCLPAVGSAWVKEWSLRKMSVPVDPHYLSLRVSFYEVFILFAISPLVYKLQGIGSATGLLPLSGTASLTNGWTCVVLGMKPSSLTDEGSGGSSLEDPQCSWGFVWVLAYVLSALLASNCVDGVVKYSKGVKIMHRSMTVSVLFGFIVMAVYSHCYGGHVWQESSVNAMTGLSLFLLLVGLEIF
ncbi:unnamed protein product, partial [Chrysoparadoxa australica]